VLASPPRGRPSSAQTSIGETREGGYEGDILTPTDDVIRANGGKAEYVEADAANYTAVDNLVNSAVSSFGRFDVMVNNADIFTACTPSSTRPAVSKIQ
jgi:NAD(P)-dependent dehydrogenase (short-subunit alcohol dehydrogenase family)